MGAAGIASLYHRVPRQMIFPTTREDFIFPWYGSREL
jgi:hypothetical protein